MIDDIKSRLNGVDRGVSPVIGVILMVAITVTLAAVIGSFVLGLGGEVSDTAPQAQLEVDNVAFDGGTDPNSVTATIRHGGGDGFDLQNTDVIVEEGGEVNRFEAEDSLDTNSLLETGGTFNVTVDNQPAAGSDSVTINGNDIWTQDDMDGGDQNISSLSSNTANDAGNRVTITIADDSSGEIIFEQTFEI